MVPGLSYGASTRFSIGGIGAVMLLHGIGLWALLQTGITPAPLPLQVVEISLLPAAVPAPQPAQPSKPRPIERRSSPPRPPRAPTLTHATPLASAPDASLSIDSAPVAEKQAGATAENMTNRVSPAPPSPTVAPVQAPTAAQAAAQPTQPRFDADYLDNPTPGYPALSRRLGEEGRVLLHVQVAASGLVKEIRVHTGSGSIRLDRAATEAVRYWKFVPARLGGKAVAAAVLIPIVFSLKD